MNRLFAAVLGLVLLAGLAPVAGAQSARQMRQEVEASMLVTGHVDIDRDGRVTAHVLDRPEELPPFVRDLIGRGVPELRFEPVLVDGAPVLARARMSVRVVATPAPGDNMDIRIASAHFGDAPSGDARSPTARDLKRPRYPEHVARMGGAGTVYLLVKVARDGSVADVVAEQINLTALGTARQMDMIRTALSRTAVENARRHWRFTPPGESDEASSDGWVVRVPVEFSLDDARSETYGHWSAYHPGQRTRPDWAAPTAPGFSPDALAAGTAAPESSRFRLLTPLGG